VSAGELQGAERDVFLTEERFLYWLFWPSLGRVELAERGGGVGARLTRVVAYAIVYICTRSALLPMSSGI